MTILWCIVPEIWSVMDRIFCHFGLFFALLHKELKFWKTEKNTWRYHHFTSVPKIMIILLYCSLDMACNGCNCYFSFWAIFCSFTTKQSEKSKFKKKKIWKNCLEIYVSQKLWSDDVWFLRYGAWQTDRDRWRKWHIEVGVPHKN